MKVAWALSNLVVHAGWTYSFVLPRSHNCRSQHLSHLSHKALMSTSTNTNDKVETSEPPEKPAYPEGYEIPKVWEFKEQGGSMGGMNRPTAGARSEKELPKGEHELQLYSLGTPNGVKVTILLEELNDLKGTEYDAWKVSIFELEQFGSEFVSINPNSKIPAMIDTSFDPPLRVFESGHILKYIAEKYGAFIPTDPRKRVETFNWLFWNMGSAPFMGGGFGHFYRYAPVKVEYAIDRYSMETKRQLDVLDKELSKKEYLAGDEITIADFAVWPWIYCVLKFYEAGDFLEFDSYTNLKRWYEQVAERPAVKRGIRVNAFGDDAVAERHSRADFD